MQTRKIRTVLSFDEERAEFLFRIANDWWRDRADPRSPSHPFLSPIVLPQDMYPRPEDRVKHALWLFYAAIFMRGGVISEDPFRPLWALYQAHPGMFDPRTVVSEWPTARIMLAMRRAGFSKYKRREHAKAWRFNSVTLAKHWRGNPLLFFRAITDFEDAFARVDYKRAGPARRGKGIMGMRRKIFSLYVVWLQEAGLIRLFPAPIPVDFHAMRILWATGVIRVEQTSPFAARGAKDGKPSQANLVGFDIVRVTEDMVDQITLWTQRFIHKERPKGQGMSHVNVNPFLWCWSREVCVQHRQNGSIKGGADYYRPELLAERPSLWGRDYADMCHRCPVRDMCTGAVPNKPHYLWGLLVRIMRADFPRMNGVLAHFPLDDIERIFLAKTHPRPRRIRLSPGPGRSEKKPLYREIELFPAD